jgi:hypothetical protein
MAQRSPAANSYRKRRLPSSTLGMLQVLDLGRHGCSPVISDMRACARSQACVRRVCECVRGVCCATTFATDIPSAARASPSPVFPDLVPVRRLSVAAWGRALHRIGPFTVRSCLGRHWQSRRQVLAPAGTLTASLSRLASPPPAAPGPGHSESKPAPGCPSGELGPRGPRRCSDSDGARDSGPAGAPSRRQTTSSAGSSSWTGPTSSRGPSTHAGTRTRNHYYDSAGCPPAPLKRPFSVSESSLSGAGGTLARLLVERGVP